MKIGLVGGTTQQWSLPFDAQDTINFYPVLDDEGKEVSALYGTPGLTLVSYADPLAGRGSFPAANGRGFFVAGTGLYEINSDFNTTLLGTLSSSTGTVSIAENGLQLAVCDGQNVYIFTYATGAFVAVSDPDFPGASTIDFIDGYFVISVPGSGKFFISALYDGTSWDALDFSTAESSPDNLGRVKNAIGQLWLLGTLTSEVWTNTGASAFPFERIAGAKMDVGILAPQTALEFDNSLFWVGQDKNGDGIVYRANGFTPQRISTESIERIIQAAPDKANLNAYTYQEGGHAFYVVTGGGMPVTLCYDLATQLWHKRAFLNNTGQYEQHLLHSVMYIFGIQLGVSRKPQSAIYQMSSDFYSDAQYPLSSERIFRHISNENQRLQFKQLEIAIEAGVGAVTGESNVLEPQIVLWISRDGGKTWSNGYSASMGRIGQDNRRAVWRRLGTATNITFKIRITDQVKRALIGAYLK